MTFEDFSTSPEGFWNHTKAFAKYSAFSVGLLAMVVLALGAAESYIIAHGAVRYSSASSYIWCFSAIAVMSGVNHFFGNDTETSAEYMDPKTAVEHVESKDASTTSTSPALPK